MIIYDTFYFIFIMILTNEKLVLKKHVSGTDRSEIVAP